MSYYLGLFIKRNRKLRKMFVSQPKYIDDIIEKYELIDLEIYPSTPMAYYISKEKEKIYYLDTKGIKDYQSRIGSLLFLAIMSRPDILFAVQCCSRFSKDPTNKNLKAANRTLYYIKGTKDKGIQFHSDNGVILHATVDVSYATHADMKSHTGMTLHIGNHSGACLAQSKKQTIIADSSTVAELIGTHTISKEILWARRFLASIGYEQKQPTVLYEDNMSTISMIKNKSNGKRTKHVELRYTIIRDHITNKLIAVEWMPTADMTADILTKSLAPAPFVHLRGKLLGLAVTRIWNKVTAGLQDFLLKYHLSNLL